MNKICLSGNLTSDPILTEHENDVTRCTMFVANNVYFGDSKTTGFYRVTAWGKLAKIVSEKCKTGTKVFITGRLEQYRYEDENGKTIYDNSIVMEQFDLDSHKSLVEV